MTRNRRWRSATIVALIAASAAHAQRPIVRVIGTGGTIGSAGDYWNGNPTRVPIDALVKVPGIDSVATVESEQFLNVSSSAIGPARWLELSRRILLLQRERPDLSGVVVTHGTDTMEETAYFLDLTVGSERPVVVTGSMRPSDMAGADGPANLTNAVRAAASVASRGRGALVLMDDRIFSAHDVTKTNTTRVETFQAPDRGPVAIVDPEGIFFRGPTLNRTAPQFDISAIRELPRVDIVYAYPGGDGAAITALVEAGAKGIVVAGAGRGNIPPDQASALRAAAGRGVVIVASSRTGSGRVPIGTTGNIGSGDLNPQKARVLLMLALSRTSDVAHIRKIFSDSQ